MNFKEIKELIEILDQSNLTEINIEDNKGSVVNLKKEKETEIITPQVAQQPAQQISQPQAAPQPQSTTQSGKKLKNLLVIITKRLMRQWLVHSINHLRQRKMLMFK